MPDAGSAPGAANRLVLPDSIRQEILIHLLQCAPNEGVGMLGVLPPADSAEGFGIRGEMFIPGRNLEASPTHFTMDPHDVVKAFRIFRERGMVLGAIVHSHVKGPATPSESDVNEWNYPEALMLIASFAHQPPELGAWRVREDGPFTRVQRVQLEILPATDRTSGVA